MTLFSVPARLLLVATFALGASGCFPAGNGLVDEEKDPHFLAGKARYNSMDYEGAIEAFERALASNPNSAAAHLQLGFLYEEKKGNFGAAIYHFEKHLELRPESNVAEPVKQRVTACKLELAKTVPFALVNAQVQDELRKLHETKAALLATIDQLKAQLVAQESEFSNRLAAATQVSSPIPTPRSYSEQPERRVPPSQRLAPVPQVSSSRPSTTPRLHIVKKGETLSMISRKYNVRLSSLQAANPSVEPRRMQAGQVVKVPARD